MALGDWAENRRRLNYFSYIVQADIHFRIVLFPRHSKVECAITAVITEQVYSCFDFVVQLALEWNVGCYRWQWHKEKHHDRSSLGPLTSIVCPVPYPWLFYIFLNE